MNTSGWIQLAIYIALLLAITKPMGIFLFKVLDANGKTFLDPVLKPFEKLFYKLIGVDPHKEQNWKQYCSAMLIFSFITAIFTYGILRLQAHLPWHGIIDGLSNKTDLNPHLSFNTAMSFTTNTNWQFYTGENTMSYFSQMVGLASHNFWSAATGIAIAAALIRGIARDKASTLGNFWTDITRIQLYILLPICILYALFLVSQGVVDNFKPYTPVTVIDQTGSPPQQLITQGPV